MPPVVIEDFRMKRMNRAVNGLSSIETLVNDAKRLGLSQGLIEGLEDARAVLTHSLSLDLEGLGSP